MMFELQDVGEVLLADVAAFAGWVERFAFSRGHYLVGRGLAV